MFSPPEPDLYDQAVALLRKGEYEQAVADFTTVIRDMPDKAEAYLGRGLAYRSLNEDAKAESDEKKAQELYRIQAEAWIRQIAAAEVKYTKESKHPVTVASMTAVLRQHQLLSAQQLEEIGHWQLSDLPSLAEALKQRGWLTTHQTKILLQDQGQQLRYGPYVLLEPLDYEGGGISSPFKARQQNPDRLVVLDAISKLLASNRKAVEDYQRKVRTLSHPHVVSILDFGQTDDAYFAVSEYIEGATDLAQLLKSKGPLPVAQACNLIRQAALGLQHVLENGMIHGDIKPHDLLLLPDGRTVKIRNTGLRLIEQPDFAKNEFIQVEHVFDYIAPELIKSMGSMDIRSDLYSLGCMFYHLFAGRVPFLAATLTETIFKQMLDNPAPVEQLRPDVPPAVAAIVRKLMAKRPEDRYQTPSELAVALTR